MIPRDTGGKYIFGSSGPALAFKRLGLCLFPLFASILVGFLAVFNPLATCLQPNFDFRQRLLATHPGTESRRARLTRCEPLQ